MLLVYIMLTDTPTMEREREREREGEREKEAVASVSTMERERLLLPVYLHFTEAWRQNPYTVDFCLEFISRVADLMVSRSMKHNTHT
jgi:hypothetical protein